MVWHSNLIIKFLQFYDPSCTIRASIFPYNFWGAKHCSFECLLKNDLQENCIFHCLNNFWSPSIFSLFFLVFVTQNGNFVNLTPQAVVKFLCAKVFILKESSEEILYHK